MSAASDPVALSLGWEYDSGEDPSGAHYTECWRVPCSSPATERWALIVDQARYRAITSVPLEGIPLLLVLRVQASEAAVTSAIDDIDIPYLTRRMELGI